MTDQILVAERVRKTYRTGAEEVAALRDVDLVVREGEFVSVMGPSGSGKTTLLNCCSGLDDIDGGRVLLDGVDLHLSSDAERTGNRASSMGFIFQAYNLIPVFNAAENVELPTECTSLVSEYGRCLGKPSDPIVVARTEHTKTALLDEAARDPNALPRLRAKCVSARERLTAACH